LAGVNLVKIETERLIIRTLLETDLTDYEKVVNEVMLSYMSAKEFLTWNISHYSDMDIIHSTVCFGIFDKEEHFMGIVGAGQHDDLHEPEIFYELLPDARGKGYATEAVKAITAWALKNYNIPFIIGTAAVDNVKSQHVLERCDYQLVDKRTLLVHVEGKKYDFKYYRCYQTK
jgi:RimJ/RimL family protein N-acetyltransferase